MTIVPPVPPEVMTWRARAYIGVSAARNVALGGVAIGLPGDFDGDSYAVITRIAPITIWGVMFFLGGAHLAYAAITGTEGHARTGICLSAVSTSLWATGFYLAYFSPGGVVTLVGAIVFTALTLKDLIVCAQPMRSPFERIVKEYVGPRGG
jgi:hypothetical protein